MKLPFPQPGHSVGLIIIVMGIAGMRLLNESTGIFLGYELNELCEGGNCWLGESEA